LDGEDSTLMRSEEGRFHHAVVTGGAVGAVMRL
jgi:hypothetical protein